MDRKLVVLGIPWEIDTEGLREYMTKFGGLEDCIVMKERSSGRSRGFGYVTFVSAEDAKAVLSSEHFLGKRMLEVKVATPKEEMRAPSKKATRIFVARIPPSVTETTFRSHFEKYGEIIDLYMPKDPKRTGHRGFGFVTFAEDGVADRVSRRSHEICGHQVAIDSATPIDDAGPSGNFMMSGPEPFGSYAGPMRNFGRMYGTLDYDDWGYGMGSARPSRADWRNVARDLQDVACVPCSLADLRGCPRNNLNGANDCLNAILTRHDEGMPMKHIPMSSPSMDSYLAL
ncbi:hypothetical protein D5086_014799 [Populus alba]|uniref:Uncharacterized protein n=1 Tax=Populus alba TaxID=43335 RepID=A0ACC4BYH8_POPAL